MTDQQHILQLLQTLMDSGESPEEVCADRPELLADVREQWEQCRRIDAHIDALFGSSSDSTGNHPDLIHSETDFPQIPGYQLLAIEGRGGVGIVYRARHLELRRIVAIKMLLSGAYAGRVERTRFLREARAVACLRHSNIVHVYEVGEFKGRPFFTMELVEGKTLAEWLGGTPQPSPVAARMLLTLALAIESAHQCGIIHRDLKPTNVLMTLDEIPKISDFGLASRTEDDDELTLSGTRVGTPSYMAPEQALARENVTPEADVYSLGAILYEMLTGRPPFRGESTEETVRQLLEEDPIKPTKLNRRVSRDLETICLKCLQKDPRRRYPTALALADDLRHFQQGEPISARQTSAPERTVKWMGRHPAATTAILSGVFIAAGVIAGISWFVSQRSATTAAAEQALAEGIRFQQQSLWSDADAALDRATDRLGDHGSADLHRQLVMARRDSQLAAKLDAIRLDRAGSTGSLINFRKADGEYRDAFLDWNIGTVKEKSAFVAPRVVNSDIRAALVGAMYDWMICTDQTTRQWLWDICSTADRDPTGFRDGIHAPDVWDNGPALSKMADDAQLGGQSVPFLLVVANRLGALGQDEIPFLTRAQQACPQDYWVNLNLADELKIHSRAADSVRYFQAAIAIHPDEAVPHNNLGLALEDEKKFDEAVLEFRRSIRIAPNAAPPLENLAVLLYATGRMAESLQPLREYLQTDPRNPYFRLLLGQALEKLGKPNDAIDQYRMVTQFAPKMLQAQKSLTDALLAQGRVREALLPWSIQLDIDPSRHEVWDGFAELALYLHQKPLYQQSRDCLLARFGQSSDPNICERVGRACLLMPGSDDETRRATALIDRAITLDNVSPTGFQLYFKVAKALAEYRNGHFESAIAMLNGDKLTVLGPAPRIILAMSLQRLGQTEPARMALAQAVSSFDWNTTADPAKDVWMYYVLRREAQAMIPPAPAAPPAPQAGASVGSPSSQP